MKANVMGACLDALDRDGTLTVERSDARHSPPATNCPSTTSPFLAEGKRHAE
jgi:hypothetical protein